MSKELKDLSSAFDELERLIAQDLYQRTDQWHSTRLGRFTSSEIYKLMGIPKDTAGKLIGQHKRMWSKR
jgi:hypothetical protein